MSSSLPIGWENRSNRMSEKDMKLGGIAATKFIDKSLSNPTAEASTANSNAYSGSTSGIYQNSDQVREHYLRQIEMQQQQQDDSPFSSSNHHASQNTTTTPMFWKERQQMRRLEAEGFRNQDAEKSTKTSVAPFSGSISASSLTQTTTSTGSSNCPSAHTALVKVATHTLESLADVLEAEASNVEIAMQDRAAFAKAIQRAMQALASAKK